MAAGQQLRSLRERRGITVRHVEEASRRIADTTCDPRYRLSNGWLVQLEKCVSPPNIHHLFALCAIYRVPFLELLRLYGINVEDQAKFEAVANPQLTQILAADAFDYDFAAPSVTRLAPEIASRPPAALKFARNNGRANTTYAQLGSRELTMYPLIRPGAILAIDTTQNKIELGPWDNKFERPIYFVELRDGFTCGWCERSGNKLRIVAYRAAPAREFTCPHEAEIVGRVVAYYTPCVDLAAAQPAQRAMGR